MSLVALSFLRSVISIKWNKANFDMTIEVAAWSYGESFGVVFNLQFTFTVLIFTILVSQFTS